MPGSLASNRYLIGGIMLAVLAWGVFHAVGAWGLNGNPWRAVVVVACSAGFIGFWWLMLNIRQAADDRQEKP